MTEKNIAVIVLDTARGDCFHPSDRLQRFGNMNDIKEEGTYYENAISAAPWSLPSHASLFTGRFPSAHGAHAGHKTVDGSRRLPEVLRSNGYETVAVSNNTWISDEFGFDRGFDTFHKNWQYVQSDTDIGKVARKEEGLAKFIRAGREVFRGNPIINVLNSVYALYQSKGTTDDGAEKANEWIADWLAQREPDRPFFLFVNYMESHLQYDPPREYAEQFLPEGVSYEDAMEVNQNAWRYITGKEDMDPRDFEILRSLYTAAIKYLDDQIGHLRELLERENEWEDTIFVITADHGENIGDHELMDHQYSLADTLLNVPLIVRGGPFEQNQISNQLVQLPDLAPTLLDAVDIEDERFCNDCQGTSFLPGSEPREFAVAEYMAPQPTMEALEQRVGVLPEFVYEYDRSLRTIRTSEWKLIRGSDGSKRLFDLRNDPAEAVDVSREHPEQVTRLENELDSWLASFEQSDRSGEVTMTQETEQRLEDLGYLQ